MAFVMEMADSQSMHHAMMNMDDMGEDDDCCDKIETQSDCSKNNHECCFAPVPTTTTPVHFSEKKEKKDLQDHTTACLYFYSFSQQDLLQNQYISDLSPPGGRLLVQSFSYVALTGVIRNIS